MLLYSVYALFLAASLWSFGPQIGAGFARPTATTGWWTGGLTYASYNVIGAVLILPVLRHLRCGRDAVIAGVLAGPLAMAPAIVFFVCLVPFYPAIMAEPLPSDIVLNALGSPALRVAFQGMVFFALLECSVGFVQAFVARVDAAYAKRGRAPSRAIRLLVPAAIVVGSVFVATAVGLVTLIAQGYRLMAYATLLVFIVPLFTVGLMRLRRGEART